MGGNLLSISKFSFLFTPNLPALPTIRNTDTASEPMAIPLFSCPSFAAQLLDSTCDYGYRHGEPRLSEGLRGEAPLSSKAAALLTIGDPFPDRRSFARGPPPEPC